MHNTSPWDIHITHINAPNNVLIVFVQGHTLVYMAAFLWPRFSSRNTRHLLMNLQEHSVAKTKVGKGECGWGWPEGEEVRNSEGERDEERETGFREMGAQNHYVLLSLTQQFSECWARPEHDKLPPSTLIICYMLSFFWNSLLLPFLTLHVSDTASFVQ